MLARESRIKFSTKLAHQQALLNVGPGILKPFSPSPYPNFGISGPTFAQRLDLWSGRLCQELLSDSSPPSPPDLGGFGHNHPLGSSSDVMNGCCLEAPWYPPLSPPTGESQAAAPFSPSRQPRLTMAAHPGPSGCPPPIYLPISGSWVRSPLYGYLNHSLKEASPTNRQTVDLQRLNELIDLSSAPANPA